MRGDLNCGPVLFGQNDLRKPPIFYVFGVTRLGIEPRPPVPREDALTTRLRGGGELDKGINETWDIPRRADL